MDRISTTLFVALLILLPIKARAQPPEIALQGVARTGSDSRPVRFHFACSSNSGPNLTGALSVELEVPQVEQLRSIFNVDPFEGPDANTGALSHLEATGAHGKAQANFTAAGSYSANPSTSFVLEVSAARRPPNNARLKLVAAVLRPLIDAPSKLVWRQGNPDKKGAALLATLQIETADADKLRASLGSCLAAK